MKVWVFSVQSTASLYGVWILKWKHRPQKASARLLARKVYSNKRPSFPAAHLPPRLGQQGNYIILEMEWKHFTSKCKWNALLLTELPIKKQHLEHKGSAKTVGTLVTGQLKTSCTPFHKGPRRKFFLFHFFHPVFICKELSTMHLHMGSGRPCVTKAWCVPEGINEAFLGFGIWHSCKVNLPRPRYWERKQWYFSPVSPAAAPTSNTHMFLPVKAQMWSSLCSVSSTREK